MRAVHIDEVAGHFYDAALEPSRLATALKSLATLANATGANFLQGHGSDIHVVEQVGKPAEAIDAYNLHWKAHDPLTPLGLRSAPGAWLNDGREFGADRRYLMSGYYNDFLRHHGQHAVLANLLSAGESGIAAISLQRAPSQGFFSEQDEERLQPLVPHLQRASRLYSATRMLRERLSLCEGALDQVAQAVWVVEDAGRLRIANAAAEALLQEGRGLQVRNGVLTASGLQAKWEAALKRATTLHLPRVATWLTLRGSNTLTPLLVAPLVPTSPLARSLQRPLAVILAPGPGCRGGRAAAALQALFGLTSAETRVALSVGQGRSLSACSEELGVSVHTIRAQLAAVFAKVGVRRQAELAAFLNQLC